MNLNIATFNINKNDGDFPTRIYNLSNEIDKYKIDIIAFQEDFRSQEFSSSDIINEKIKYKKYTLKTREKTRNGMKSSSNLTILSRLDLENIDSIYFDEIENEQRAALFAVIKIEKKNLLLVNTHLCHISIENRIYQINSIINYINQSQIDNVVICGDLNSTPDSKVLEVLQSDGFEYNNKQITASRGKIIDYILFKGEVSSVNSEIVLKEFSDHYCLVNKISF